MTEQIPVELAGEPGAGAGRMSAIVWTNRKLFFNPAPFAEFHHRSTGVGGLAWESSIDAIYLLAIISLEPGKGHFRAFVEDLKKSYRRIGILDIWNSWLKEALVRYGFIPFSVEVHKGERSEGMLWTKALDEERMRICPKN